jgi:Predicted nucleic acid-binding protein, contains PIN domain
MFVVDASVTLAWCFDDEASAATEAVLRRLLLEGAIAPAHWSLEVGNGLRVGERRGRIDRSKLASAESLLTELLVDVVPVDIPTMLRAVALARRHDLTVYDAAYLDLAATRGLGLATIDEQLMAACRKARVRLIAA